MFKERVWVWKLVIECTILILLQCCVLFICVVVHARLQLDGKAATVVAKFVVLFCRFCILVIFRVHHKVFHCLGDQPSLACCNGSRTEVTNLFFLTWLFVWFCHTVLCIVEIISMHVPREMQLREIDVGDGQCEAVVIVFFIKVVSGLVFYGGCCGFVSCGHE